MMGYGDQAMGWGGAFNLPMGSYGFGGSGINYSPTYGSDAQLYGQMYGSDNNLRGIYDTNLTNYLTAEGNARFNRQNLLDQFGNQKDIANINANASMFPAKMQQERFGQVFPWLKDTFGQYKDTLQMMAGGIGGGAPPQVDTNPLYSRLDMQHQVNQAQANNNASAQGAARQAREHMGPQAYNQSRVQDIGRNYGMQALNANTRAANDIPMQMQGANAQNRMQAQQANAQNAIGWGNMNVNKMNAFTGGMNPLWSTFAGLV